LRTCSRVHAALNHNYQEWTSQSFEDTVAQPQLRAPEILRRLNTSKYPLCLLSPHAVLPTLLAFSQLEKVGQPNQSKRARLHLPPHARLSYVHVLLQTRCSKQESVLAGGSRDRRVPSHSASRRTRSLSRVWSVPVFALPRHGLADGWSVIHGSHSSWKSADALQHGGLSSQWLSSQKNFPVYGGTGFPLYG
jgi:hypothetical protein